MPGEPDLSSPQPVLFVRHQSIGLVKRIFPEDAKMYITVYLLLAPLLLLLLLLILLLILYFSLTNLQSINSSNNLDRVI